MCIIFSSLFSWFFLLKTENTENGEFAVNVYTHKYGWILVYMEAFV